MIAYWTQFARHGNPNRFRARHSPAPFWPRFEAEDEDEDFQSLVPPTPQIESDFATRHHCAFWGAHGI